MIFIFDSHPVQYKAPVYQRLQEIRPDCFRVIYATDSTMRGHHDRDFQAIVSWDTPLLEGYAYTVLGNEKGKPFEGFGSLTGRGVFALLREKRPRAALISQFHYAFDLAAYASCVWLRIPIWIRHETQDEAFLRPAWKAVARGFAYRLAYGGVDHAFYIGELNREHLLRYGVAEGRMSRAPYCVPVRGDVLQLKLWRSTVRERLGIGPDEVVLLFSGKFIEKKNPQLIFEALARLSDEERERSRLVFVGAGPLEAELRAAAAVYPGRVHFTGFVNQTEIPHYYAAADVLLLTSRRAGETWGLVVNEALQAGCGVIMTRAVGSHREFGSWERVRVIEEGDASGCADALRELSRLPRSFEWCAEKMKDYSVDTAAAALAQKIDSFN